MWCRLNLTKPTIMKGFNCQKCFHNTSCITALLHFEIAAECVSISVLTLRLDLSGHVSVRLPDHPAALQGLKKTCMANMSYLVCFYTQQPQFHSLPDLSWFHFFPMEHGSSLVRSSTSVSGVEILEKTAKKNIGEARNRSEFHVEIHGKVGDIRWNAIKKNKLDSIESGLPPKQNWLENQFWKRKMSLPHTPRQNKQRLMLDLW